MPAPTVSACTPNFGSLNGGAFLTLTGTNFTGATGVTIGGVAATNLTVVSATSITITAPAGSAGVASVVVTNPSGSNGANSLFFYTGTGTPTDTYIYLKGGRGDGLVPQWTGIVTESDSTEQSDPYRNSVAGITTRNSFDATLNPNGGPQYVQIPTIDPGTGNPTAYSIVMDDALKDAKDGTCPPRQYAKKTTWLIFTSSNGNDYKFRKDSVVGWGSAPR